MKTNGFRKNFIRSQKMILLNLTTKNNEIFITFITNNALFLPFFL